MNSQSSRLDMLHRRSSHSDQNLKKESNRAKVLLLIALSLTVIVALWFAQSYLRNESRAALATRQTLLLYDKEQQEQTDLIMLMENLSDNNENIREGNRKRIIELGQQSNENRQIVITELLKRVEAPDFRDRLTTRAGSYFWVEVCEIFYGLKAVETIDFLIDCIDCPAISQIVNNRYRHKPAVPALIGLGQPAVPRLAQKLYNPDPQIRIYAAVCLGNIQGDAARQALSDSLRNESDLDVQVEIKRAIDAIDRRPFEGR